MDPNVRIESSPGSEQAPESPRNLIFERLQTEYGEEEEQADYDAIKAELKRWSEVSVFLLASLIILQVREFSSFSLSYPAIPFLIYETKTIISDCFYLRYEQSRATSFKSLIASFGELIFWVMLIFYFETQAFNFILLIIPLFVFSFLALLVKTTVHSQCQSFSGIYFFCGKWVKILTVLSVGLKIDGFTTWNWIGVLWPVWVALSFLCVMTVGGLLITITAVCAFIYRENSAGDLYSALWLLYAISGSFATFTIMFVSLINNSTSLNFIWPIFYILVLVLTEFLLFQHLIKWWRNFFGSNEQFSLPSASASSNLPLPAVQNRFRYPKIVQMIKLPPQALLRLSGTYFKPVQRQPPIAVARTISDFHEQKPEAAHIRSLSTPHNLIKRAQRNRPSDLSFLDKKCEICFENECDAVIMECGHGGICSVCAEVLMNSKGKCHMCRGDIEQVLKIKVEANKELKVIGVSNCLS